jgi:hypothetical protein
MSSPAALATVTATLRHLLSTAPLLNSGVTITTQPPSTARSNGNNKQVNIFLYSVHYSPAFRNEPMPGKAKNGGASYPSMPLILKYLITAYGEQDNDISGQALLGEAMSLLHDHPLLGKADIEGIEPDSGLQQQVERIRITPDTLTLDDMSKLWSSFQSAEYRLSVGYEVSVVLIESKRDGKAPLPVLKRGEDDRGAQVLPGPQVLLFGLRFLNQKPSAELDDPVTLLGEHLSSDHTKVRFRHPLLKNPIDVLPTSVQNGTEMTVQLPGVDEGAHWPAGFYTLSLLIERPDSKEWASNQLSMSLAPTISVALVTALAGNVDLTIECVPQIQDKQEVVLLFGDRIIPLPQGSITTPSDSTAPSTVTFTVNDVTAKPEPYVVRLRIDGVDSIPVDFSGNTPTFAVSQQVTIS